EDNMSGSVYKVIELIGSSPKSWEDAVENIIMEASKSLRDIRVAEVSELDVRVEDGKIAEYRTKVRVSFRYEKK
ncbi:MAG TPA: dodecin family protein, partial [Methanotrichaceae archaeon]|nr:dodecin family protein [Methanotrichaceae archaeon]